jgi:hypothetical protein
MDLVLLVVPVGPEQVILSLVQAHFTQVEAVEEPIMVVQEAQEARAVAVLVLLLRPELLELQI